MRSPFTFNNLSLRMLRATAEICWARGLRNSFSDPENGPVPGFWIVGDEGVYIMGNGKTLDGERQPLVYAKECDPTSMPFDAWWAYKNAGFGGDDGVEFIEQETVEAIIASGNDMVVEFTPTEMIVSELVPS